jgi:hypothetical protein
LTHHAALYNAAAIILWVEDLVTAAYLGELWQRDPRFKFYIGGGHENLAALVEDARRSGHRGVFGLRDRDFGPSNRARWGVPEVVNFALETFEIECFLLDPTALASCVVNTAKRSETEIRERLIEQARGMLWWMACRHVLAGLREARQQGFPSHPRHTAITSREAAEHLLLTNPWVQTTVPGLATLISAGRLRQALSDAHDHYVRHLIAGTWEREMSGKEVVTQLVSWIYTRGRPPGDAALQDLAKAVAREQLRANRAPAELLELRDVLVARSSPAAT